jgi:hypothetical protein
MPRTRTYDKIPGLSNEEQGRLRKSHQVSKVVVGEERADILKNNPDVGRKLIEEEIKLSKHNRARQNAIKVRLMEEEIRRADAHWRKSDTITKASSLPSRVLEASILFLAMGSGKAASEVLREKVSDRETRLGAGGIKESIRSMAYQQAKRDAAEEYLTRHNMPRELTQQERKVLVDRKVQEYLRKADDATDDVSGGPRLVEDTPKLSSADMKKLRAKIRKAAEEAGEFRTIGTPGHVEGILDDLSKVNRKDRDFIGAVDVGRVPFLSESEKRMAMRTPVSEWNPSLREAVARRLANDPTDEIMEEAKKKWETSSKAIEANPITKAYYTGKAAASSVGSTIRKAIRTTPELKVLYGEGEGFSKALAEAKRSRKIVGAVAGAVGAAGLGLELYKRSQNKKKEQQIIDYYGEDNINDLYSPEVDPSERVKKSWIVRRQKYGKSGVGL